MRAAVAALAALALSFYLQTEETDICAVQRLAADEDVVLRVELERFPPRSQPLYIAMRTSLRRGRGPLQHFNLQDAQSQNFIYHHAVREDVYICLSSFLGLRAALAIDHRPVAPAGLLTTGDLHGLEAAAHRALAALAGFNALHQGFADREELAVRRGVALDCMLVRLGLFEAALLLALCAAQYLFVARLVAAAGKRPEWLRP